MALAIPIPDYYSMTTNWWEIQEDNLNMFSKDSSKDTNKLLKALGKGSFFVVYGFQLGLFVDIVDGKKTLMAELRPGIYVHDFTVIDYASILRPLEQNIYIKVFDEDDMPAPTQIYRIGSKYYHGIVGDGIEARPTYSTLVALSGTPSTTSSSSKFDHFRTFHRLTLNEYYGSNGDVIDLDNIDTEDERYDQDPDDPIEWEEPEEDIDDPTTVIAREQALKWAWVFGKW
jgi:hypothetical protein